MPIEELIKSKFKDEISFKGDDKIRRTLITDQYLLSKLYRRLKKKYTVLIIICGQQRIGKSFIAIYLSYMMMKLLGKDYNPTKNTFYEPMKAIKELGDVDSEPFVIDEAGSLLSRREWFNQTHQALDKIIQTQGYKTMLYIFVSPFASDIDKIFQKHFDFILRVDERGRYKAFQIIKKYDEFKQEKSTKRIFLDDVRIKKGAIPKEIWEKYFNFSIQEKEKLRKKKERTKEKRNYNDPIQRLKDKVKV